MFVDDRLLLRADRHLPYVLDPRGHMDPVEFDDHNCMDWETVPLQTWHRSRPCIAWVNIGVMQHYYFS